MIDLSDIFFSQIPINISELIATELSVKDSCITTKIDTKFILVKSAFNFEKASFEINYIIPAITASYFFNSMMMDESEPSDEISNDMGDAIKEIISTINGNIATISNGEKLDLGELKVETQNYELIEDPLNYDGFNNLIKFTILANEKTYDLLLDIQEEAKEYFTKFFEYNICDGEEEQKEDNKEESETIEKETSQEESNDNDDENSTKNSKEDSNDSKIENKTQEESIKENDKEEDNKSQDDKKEESKDEKIENKEESDGIDKKTKRIKLLIIIVASLLGLTLIAFATMYFMGFFEKKEEVKKVKVYKNIRKNKLYKIDIKDKKIDFDMSMINVDRLNKRLSLLTKYEILDDDILEKFKQEERQRLHNLKIAELEKFANSNKEERIKKDKNEQFSIEDRLIYLKIEPLKYKKYKKIIDDKLPPHSSVSICKDKNSEVFIYIGPLVEKKRANILVKDVKNLDRKKETRLISLTKDEFNSLCDF